MKKGAGATSYMTKIFFPCVMENSSRFSLNIKKISVLGENSPSFPIYDGNLRTQEKILLDFL
jgi:hypothetical protein